MVLQNLTAGQNEETDKENKTYGHGEKGGQDEMYGESNIETYITIHKINRNLLYVSGN